MTTAPRRFRFLNQQEFNALSTQERVDYLREALAPVEAVTDSAAPAIQEAANLRAIAQSLRADMQRRTLARSRRIVRRAPRS